MLEVAATWEPAAGHDGSRLARLIRRRRPGAVTSSAVRRVAFTVVDPEARVGAIGLDGFRPRDGGRFGRSVAAAQPPAGRDRTVTGWPGQELGSGECPPRR